MPNPYLKSNKALMIARTKDPVDDALRIRDSKERFVGRNGEINASSKKELIERITELVDMYQKGDLVKATVDDRAEVMKARQELLKAAFSDRHGDAWRVLGEVIGDEIKEAMDREGFARRVMLFKPLGKGEIGRLRVHSKQVVAWMVVSNGEAVASVYRQKWVYPPDFYIIGNLLVEDMDIEQSTGDLLDELYNDGLEQIMVREDLVWKRLADVAASTTNDMFYFNTFTPSVFSAMRTEVSRWGIPCTTAIIAFDLWNDIIADNDFSNWFDPVSKYRLILEGNVGSILGTELITDAFRHERLKVLEPGEVYFLGAPQTLGGITNRKEVVAEPIHKYNEGRPMRGWFLEAIEGMAIVNSRAICKGQRI